MRLPFALGFGRVTDFFELVELVTDFFFDAGMLILFFAGVTDFFPPVTDFLIAGNAGDPRELAFSVTGSTGCADTGGLKGIDLVGISAEVVTRALDAELLDAEGRRLRSSPRVTAIDVPNVPRLIRLIA